MKRWLRRTALLLSVACTWPGPIDADEAATRLRIAEPAFHDPQTAVEEGRPLLRLAREMPTPGWQFTIDALDVDGALRRVRVKATEMPPEGPVAQRVASAVLEVPLVSLDRGSWFVEILLRRDRGDAHVPVHALRVLAY